MADDEKLSPFAKACEGQELTEAEVKQLWAEAPVMQVSSDAWDQMQAALDDDARELPQLRALVERVQTSRVDRH